jgi:hypothetical protein
LVRTKAFQKKYNHAAQDGPEFKIFLSWPYEAWDYRHVPPSLAQRILKIEVIPCTESCG